MPFAMIAAWLAEKGYRQEEVRNLTRGYVNRILGWPRDRDGTLRSPQSKQKPLSRRELLRRIFFFRGMPAHMIEVMVEEQLLRDKEQTGKTGKGNIQSRQKTTAGLTSPGRARTSEKPKRR